MPTDQTTPRPPSTAQETVQETAEETAGEAGRKRPLPPAAERALAEAAARRDEQDKAAKEGKKEVAGRGGLDPARYGDWEINGLISDF